MHALDIKELQMKVFEKPWVRLLINIGISVVLFFVLFFSLMVKDHGGAFFLGSMTIGAQIFFFLAFDTFEEIVSKFYERLRNALVIIGTIAVILFGILCTVIFIFDPSYIESPWLNSFFIMWFLNGVLSFIFYYVIMNEGWEKLINCFVPVASVIVSYFLNVIFLYIGMANSFFNAYFGMIICLVLIVIMIIIIRKEHGIQFFGTEIRRFNENFAKQEAKQISKKEKDKDKGENSGDEDKGYLTYDYAIDQLGIAMNRVAGSIDEKWRYHSDYWGWVEKISTNCSISKWKKIVLVNTNFNYSASPDTPRVDKGTLNDEAKKVREKIKDNISKSINEELADMKSEFNVLGKDWKKRINVEFEIV